MTEVQIANRALDEIGKGPISTMSDTTPTGKLVRRHFDSVARTVAAQPDWWEFDVTASLTRATSEQYNGLTNTHLYRFNLPSRTSIKVVMNVNLDAVTDYNIESSYLYANETTIFLRYVPLNITVFPEYIGSVIVPRLAAAMSKKGEGSKTKRELLDEYKLASTEARKISKTQRPPRFYATGDPYSFVTSRTDGARDSYPPNTFGP